MRRRYAPAIACADLDRTAGGAGGISAMPDGRPVSASEEDSRRGRAADIGGSSRGWAEPQDDTARRAHWLLDATTNATLAAKAARQRKRPKALQLRAESTSFEEVEETTCGRFGKPVRPMEQTFASTTMEPVYPTGCCAAIYL